MIKHFLFLVQLCIFVIIYHFISCKRTKTVKFLNKTNGELCHALMINRVFTVSYIKNVGCVSFCTGPCVSHSANSSEFRRQKSNTVSFLTAVPVFPQVYVLLDFAPSSGEVADYKN